MLYYSGICAIGIWLRVIVCSVKTGVPALARITLAFEILPLSSQLAKSFTADPAKGRSTTKIFLFFRKAGFPPRIEILPSSCFWRRPFISYQTNWSSGILFFSSVIPRLHLVEVE